MDFSLGKMDGSSYISEGHWEQNWGTAILIVTVTLTVTLPRELPLTRLAVEAIRALATSLAEETYNLA